MPLVSIEIGLAAHSISSATGYFRGINFEETPILPPPQAIHNQRKHNNLYFHHRVGTILGVFGKD
ncbi:MAG: hypothetical protein WCJ35_08240 [Planctomycetota bacterium]